jgi:1-acyl-sn-glycerol-3-phosphate acyltransferase
MGDAPDNREIAKWDPTFTRQVASTGGAIVKRWFRAEVRNVDNVPPVGGALLVSNHSGGMATPDGFVYVPPLYERFGYHRPIYVLAHYGLLKLTGPLRRYLLRIGVVDATRENAAAALNSDALVLVFPGGEYDSFRPTLTANRVDFNGHTGYVNTAIEAGVPIVPMVSIGGQETQLFLTRGTTLARRLGLNRIRLNVLPLSFGFPFGLTPIVPSNFPLPSKIVTEVLEPIDITARFGDDPDVDEVDAYVRKVMQRALDRLASQRRFPFLG